ncbi:DUF2628 domain-containing protein [Moraxella nasibovis]|uniref:DUF2628 domain-containing protein n=1 Tax=Moraxella nasibovis TaxID=2904120 RepID=UPI00240F3B50|nr:DUF2628 domain-containing protein [Moraxella nasibovis]WFF38121.1 DUF2628 domain-containing protein [Moraxella nasibovis]
MFRLPFLEDTTPPPFYRANLSNDERTKLDQWFIGLRSQSYYLKRFNEFDQAGKLHARWHWAAFFCTFGWLLYRKRYLDCVVYCVAGWSFIKVNIAIALAVLEFMVIGFLPENYQIMARVVVGGLVWLFWASMVARWADAYYYRMARREIADALDFYPAQKDEQKRHLKKEGGTSLVGMSVAFAIFGVFLAIIVGQFVPIIATKQEQAVIFESHRSANAVQKRIQNIYQSTKTCPTTLPVSTDDQRVSMVVVDRLAGIDTDCAVVATVSGASYPVRYLNGETLIIYHTLNETGQSVWRCQTSLNKKRHPKRCV